MELYKTVRQEAVAEQIIEKSRFIAHVKPVETKEEADAFISAIKSKNSRSSGPVTMESLRGLQVRLWCR